MLEMQSQVTFYPLPQRLAPLASFGPSTRWMSPSRKKTWLRACTTPTALPHATPQKIIYLLTFHAFIVFQFVSRLCFLENFGAKLFSQLFVSSGH